MSMNFNRKNKILKANFSKDQLPYFSRIGAEPDSVYPPQIIFQTSSGFGLMTCFDQRDISKYVVYLCVFKLLSQFS